MTTAQLASTWNDTYLYLKNGSNVTVAENDDFSGGNSRIVYVIPVGGTGTYTIYATSYPRNTTGLYTLSVSATGGATLPPPSSVPTAPTLTAISGDRQISLSWSAPTGATYYYLYRSDGSLYAGSQLTVTSYIISNLTNGPPYGYYVTACNTVGCSVPSNTETKTPVVPAPANLSYTTPNTFTAGIVITALVPTVTGTVTSYSASTLPAGLSINLSTGVISGIPSAAQTTTNHTVTATNAGGSHHEGYIYYG